MKSNMQHSPQFLRRRKFLVVLPLLVLPFVFAVRIALGRNTGKQVAHSDKNFGKGFNVNLPDAHFAKNETIVGKMGFYQKADEDSIKLMDRIRQDPYHIKSAPLFGSKLFEPTSSIKPLLPSHQDKLITDLNPPAPEDRRADQLLEKLEQLKKTIRRPAVSPPGPGVLQATRYGSMLSAQRPGQSRLETLIQSIPCSDTITASTADQQIEKLNGLLEKFEQIKYPPKRQITVEDTVPTRKFAVLPKLADGETLSVPELDSTVEPEKDSSTGQSDGFYSIGDADIADTAVQNAIPAVVEEDQTIVSGATVTFRLTEESHINGITIPPDNLLYGTATLNGDRMRVTISSIRWNSSIYPVSLQVYNMEGLEGFHVPGAMARDVAKESAAESIGSIGIGAFDASAAAQVTNAGVQAAKSLLGKKVKLVQVFVNAGDEVLLKNSNGSYK